MAKAASAAEDVTADLPDLPYVGEAMLIVLPADVGEDDLLDFPPSLVVVVATSLVTQ